MLQSIHDKLKGWLAGVVLGAIGLVFVFWGINWTLSAPNYAAKVNGVEISANQVREAYQRELAQVERQTNGNLGDGERAMIKNRVLDQYVNSEALVTRAESLGYRVSDEEIRQAECRVPAFQVDGKCDFAHAVALIRAQGRSPAEIDAMFASDVKREQLDRALNATSFATPGEVKQLLALTLQQREVAWMTVSADKYAAQANPDDAAIKAYYDAHKSAYMTPETVDVRYVELSLAQLSPKVKVNDAELKTYYEEQKSKTPERFVQPEQRRLSHILFVVNDPKGDAAAKGSAEAALKRAQGGEDFGKLAKDLSQDEASAKQGGDLGWQERKAMIPALADAAYAMKPGEIRGPIKTKFGYHIVKLDDIKPTAVKSFEEARAELEDEYRRDAAERMFNDAQEQLADAALQNSGDIDVVARKAGLAVVDVPGFSRTDGGGALGKVPAVIDAAFSSDVLEGHLSSIVEIDKGRGVVLRATDHKLPQQKPLDEVRAQVVASLKKQQGEELAVEAAQGAIKRLEAGDAWDAVAKSLGVTPQAPKFVSRGEQDVPLHVRTTAFGAPKVAGKTTYYSASLDNGDAAVVAFSAIREQPGDAKQELTDMRMQLAAQLASTEAESYAVGARADSKVILNPQALE
ncbi:MAG TPA: SurA N-terminal domain-containing protein [Steroidobacteraceae bacterium]|nr:SurA N-terminal domain-containing protein [Steroidobacteraceae bacterium]